MLALLRRIFIKNYEDVKNPKVRHDHGIFAGIFGIITNLIIAGIKLMAAILVASSQNWIFPMALVASSADNFADMGSSVVTLIGVHLSNKPADKNHPFGYERIEYIAGLVVSIVIVVVGVSFAKDSVDAIINFFSTGAEVHYDMLTIIILGVSIFLKVVQSRVNKKIGKLIDSLPLLATAEDSRNDALSTFGVLVAAICSYCFKWYFLDGFIGVVVSVMVVVSGIKMAFETIKPLIGEVGEKDFVDNVIKEIMKHKMIFGVHDVIAHCYGPTKKFLSLHAEVNEKEPLVVVHDEIDNIEAEIKSKYKCEITIHCDPIAVGDPLTESFKDSVMEVLLDCKSDLQMHDFRIVKGKTHINVIFDIVLPFDCKLSRDEILKRLEEKFANNKQKVYFVIRFDRPFTE